MFLDRLFGKSEYDGQNQIREAGAAEKASAFITALLVLFILLATATQALCFWIPNWWRNEYAKYDTPSNVRGEMSLDDAVSITEDMLNYCVGRLDTLDNSMATIDGVTAPFYTDREKQHLADCRELFHKGLRARAISILLSVGLLIFIYVHLGGRGAMRLMASAYLKALAAVLLIAVIVAIAAAVDFTRAFTIFHKVFFDNDLWILYPEKDNLINIMQEDVFSDAAIWIGGMWAGACAILAALSVYVLKRVSK